jgi:hypothetical protein
MLAAGAALVALGGAGAGAWMASSDDEGDPAPFERSATTATEDGESTNEVPLVPTEEEPAAPGPEPQQEDPPQEPDAAPNRDEPTRTQFPRERKQQQNDPPTRVFEVPPAREFSGTGNASLGTVNLSTAAIVKWTTKGRFELRFGREGFPIVAPSPSGQLIVPPYRFEQLRVIARGRWTIRIVPQK